MRHLPSAGNLRLSATAKGFIGLRLTKTLAPTACCKEFPPARRVSDLQEARAAAEELGYPVVVKALGLLHKSDAGGVALGIEDELGLGEALARMATLQSEQYSVERMAPVADGAELIAGCLNDPRFGPIVLVGLVLTVRGLAQL